MESPYRAELDALCLQLGQLTHNHHEQTGSIRDRLRLLAQLENAWQQKQAQQNGPALPVNIEPTKETDDHG